MGHSTKMGYETLINSGNNRSKGMLLNKFANNKERYVSASFLHKLEFVFNKNQSDGCRSQQYLKKRQKLVELYSWHRKIYANEKTVLL